MLIITLKIIAIIIVVVILISLLSLLEHHRKRARMEAIWLSRAEKGDAYAQEELGDFYKFSKLNMYLGIYNKEAFKWYTKAIEQYTKAAEQGDKNAQHSLGRMYDRGKGCKKNPVEAIKWYKKAAEQGHAMSMFCLGIIYEYGSIEANFKEDYAEAIKWYTKAAEAGDYCVYEYSLGKMYEKGLGTPQNLEEAKKWYEKAAARRL